MHFSYDPLFILIVNYLVSLILCLELKIDRRLVTGGGTISIVLF